MSFYVERRRQRTTKQYGLYHHAVFRRRLCMIDSASGDTRSFASSQSSKMLLTVVCQYARKYAMAYTGQLTADNATVKRCKVTCLSLIPVGWTRMHQPASLFCRAKVQQCWATQTGGEKLVYGCAPCKLSHCSTRKLVFSGLLSYEIPICWQHC